MFYRNNTTFVINLVQGLFTNQIKKILQVQLNSEECSYLPETSMETDSWFYLIPIFTLVNKELHSLQKGLRFFSEFLARIRPIWHRTIIKCQSELCAGWQRRQSSSSGKWRMCFSLGMARQCGYQTMVRCALTFTWKSLRIFSTRHQLPASPAIWDKAMLRIQIVVVNGVKATKRAGLQLFTYISEAFLRLDG